MRGGRYDEVGAVFGRNRPAVGFSLDLKALVAHGASARRAAQRDPRTWGEDAALRAAVRRLREQGETVRVHAARATSTKAQEFDCDRELVAVDGRWVLRAL